VSEFKQNYHISPLVEIAEFNQQRSGIYGWVGTGISALGLVVLYTQPESRLINIAAGGSATAGLYIDLYTKLLGTDPENMEWQVK
jgi:hypothetical protein